MRLSKRIQYEIEHWVVRFIVWLCSIVPLSALRTIGGGLGWMAFRVFRIRHDIVLDNIRRAFPNKDDESVERIAVRSYIDYGRSAMEFLAFKQISKNDLAKMVTCEGLENLDAALEHGKGAILFTGHYGNWELMGAVIASRGYPIHVTDTEHSNRKVHRTISQLRVAQGIRIITPLQPVIYIARLLADNQFVSYLADQDARGAGIFVDFFGRPASTLRGPAIFSIRRGCPIVPCFIIRGEADRQRVVFEAPMWPDDRLVGDEAILEFTQRFTRVLERYVTRHPEMYFWTHRRWKTKPPAP